MTNIAAGSSDDVQLLVNLGVLQIFIEILNTSQNFFVLDNVVWCLGNIAGDTIQLRDQLINMGCVHSLENLYLRGRAVMPVSKLKDLVWACGNFVKGTPLPEFEKVQHLMTLFTEQFLNSLSSVDVEYTVECCWPMRQFINKYN